MMTPILLRLVCVGILRTVNGCSFDPSPSGSVIQVMLDPHSHGMVDRNYQPIPGRAAANHGRERRMSPVCIPAV